MKGQPDKSMNYTIRICIKYLKYRGGREGHDYSKHFVEASHCEEYANFAVQIACKCIHNNLSHLFL